MNKKEKKGGGGEERNRKEKICDRILETNGFGESYYTHLWAETGIFFFLFENYSKDHFYLEISRKKNIP